MPRYISIDLIPDSFINTWGDSRADAVFAARSVLNYVTEHFDYAVPAAKAVYSVPPSIFFGLASLHGKICIGRQLLAADYTTAQLNCPR